MRTIRWRLKEGKLRSFKVGQQIRILHTDLMDYIEQQKAEAGDGD